MKRFKILGLDCANCARALEEKINKESKTCRAKISFFLQVITFEGDAADLESFVAKAKSIASAFDRGVVIQND